MDGHQGRCTVLVIITFFLSLIILTHVSVAGHDDFIFILSFSCSAMTSIKGRLSRAQIQAIKHSLDTG